MFAANVPDKSESAVGIVVLVGCAPIPAAVTCPPPAPFNVPFALILIPLFVKVAILVNPVPPDDAGSVPVTRFPVSYISPAAIWFAVILFVVIFPPSIVVVPAFTTVAGL